MHTTIPALHVGQGIHQAGLSLFPVWVVAPRIGSLEWSPSSLEVAEHSGGARVSSLEASNTSARPLVALEGDLLEGGWQNRMLGRSVVLRARERREIHAVCIERGRWGGANEQGASGRRASLAVRFGDARAGREVGAERQSGVWRRIQTFEQRLGASETSSFTRHLDRQSIRTPRLIDGQRGVIIGIGGRIMGLELFCSSSGLRSRWTGIVQSAAVDARLTDPVPTRAERARSFARAVDGRRLHGGEDGESWFELARGDEKVDLLGLGARLGDRDEHGILHLTALDRTHPVLAAV